MSKLLLVLAGGLLALALQSSLPVRAGDDFEITPAIQKRLDEWKKTAQGWCGDQVVLDAVEGQNEKGPIAGMTEDKWKKTQRRDPLIEGLSGCPAAKFLAAKAKASGGAVSELFLNAAQGEKVAFIDKTSSYVHKGKSKFDVPFETQKPWQGEPEFDESSQTYQIQLAVPVLVKDEPEAEKPTSIGVLVVGIDLGALEKPSGK